MIMKHKETVKPVVPASVVKSSVVAASVVSTSVVVPITVVVSTAVVISEVVVSSPVVAGFEKVDLSVVLKRSVVECSSDAEVHFKEVLS